MPPFPKQSSNVTKNRFSVFSRKILIFLKKLLNKIKFSISFLIKKSYIHSWCKITPYRSQSDPMFAPFNFTSTFRNIYLLTYFWRQRFFLSLNSIPAEKSLPFFNFHLTALLLQKESQWELVHLNLPPFLPLSYYMLFKMLTNFTDNFLSKFFNSHLLPATDISRILKFTLILFKFTQNSLIHFSEVFPKLYLKSRYVIATLNFFNFFSNIFQYP